jgi:hypothetical protein
MKEKMLLKPFKDLTLHRSSMRKGKIEGRKEKLRKRKKEKISRDVKNASSDPIKSSILVLTVEMV